MQLYWQKLRSLDLWLLIALTDVGVIVPWVFVLYRATFRSGWFTAVPGLWLGLLVYAASALWELGDRSENPAAARRRVAAMLAGVAGAYAIAYRVMPAGLRTGFLSWNPAVGFLPAAGYLWFMGARTVLERPGAFVLRAEYPYQLIAVTAGATLLAWGGALGYPGVRTQVTWGLMLVLVAGLLGLYVARNRDLKADQAAHGDARAGDGETSTRLGPLIAVLLVATLSLSFFSSEAAVRVVGGLFGAMAGWLRALLWLIVGKYVAVLTPVIDRLLAFLGWLSAQAQARMVQRQPLRPPMDVEQWAEELRRSRTPDYQPPVMAVGTVLGVALVALMVYLLRRSRTRRERDCEEEFVSLGFWPNLLADLKSLLRMQRPGAPGAPDESERLASHDPRLLFRRLQAWGAGQVRPRAQSETPNAYGNALGQARPVSLRAAGAVVAVYNEARYGAAPPDGARVAAAAAALAELEQAEHDETPG